ncbi:hypothetical protein QJS10_CPA09g02087 [Acorus calamus]|uniref:RNase H type-1 domain-containing protein n=1 Tax=Acorus calamus TaxID=4465 RepID=A0AAV9E757_ACOCL|nr:hypothetical protein QJS10_CPA09g02087 [Acorus calamus]
MDKIWNARNASKYDNSTPNPTFLSNKIRKSICDAIVARGPCWKIDSPTASLITSLGLHFDPTPPKSPIEVIWLKPDPPWIKLNIDGASLGNPGPSGAGGVFRDHQATFLLGFSCNTGHNTNTFAEFYGLFRGISIWFETHPTFNGYIWIESDSTLVVNTIIGKISASPLINPYVLHIHKWLNLLTGWKITHIFREGNRSADKLASLALSVPNETVFDSPPVTLAHYLNDDANEVPQYRFPKP